MSWLLPIDLFSWNFTVNQILLGEFFYSWRNHSENVVQRLERYLNTFTLKIMGNAFWKSIYSFRNLFLALRIHCEKSGQNKRWIQIHHYWLLLVEIYKKILRSDTQRIRTLIFSKLLFHYSYDYTRFFNQNISLEILHKIMYEWAQKIF